MASWAASFLAREPLAEPQTPPPIDAHTITHDMADHEPGTSQDAEPKQEDANAPINIKVRATMLSIVPKLREFAVGGSACVCASGGQCVGGCEKGTLVRRWPQS